MKIILLIVKLVIVTFEFQDGIKYQSQELYFENENVFSYDKLYAINFKDDDQLDNIDIKNDEIQLIKEIKIDYDIRLNGNEQIFSFNDKINNQIEIIILKNNSIECLFEIKNYIEDNEIIKFKSKECQILLNQQDCFNLYKLDQFIYIIQCNYNSTHTIIQIINQTSIFDSIIIPIQSNCQSDSIFNLNNSLLIIYNKLCETTLFYSIQIINYSFYNYTQYDLQDDFSLFNIPNSVLISIQFCKNEEISINFHNIYFNYLLLLKKISIQIRFEGDAKIIQRLSFCEYTQAQIVEDVKSKQLLIKNQYINISSSQFIKSFWIQQLLIFHLKDQLVVMFNNKLKQCIQYSFQNILALSELPLILGIKDNEFYVYKVDYPQNYFTVQKDYHYIKFIKMGAGILFPQAILYQKKLEIQTEQNIKFFIQSTQISKYLKSLNSRFCINHNILQKSNPFDILIIEKQSNIIQDKYNVLNLCQIQILSNMKIFIIQDQNTQNYKILCLQDNILSIQACEEDQLKHFQKIKIKNDYIGIFSFSDGLYIIIIYNYQIVLIKLNNDQIIQQIQNFNKQILNYFQDDNEVFLIFEDCNKATINLSLGKLQVSFLESYPFDCQVSLQFRYDELFITQDEIMNQLKENFSRKFLNQEGHKNIKTIIKFPYLIIVIKVQNEYKLKLFQIYNGQAIFLYFLPTYDFIITDQIQYQTHKFYLMIKVSKQNSNYLLIYNLDKTAILSLVRITKIDQNQTFFSFLSSAYVLYYLQGKFINEQIETTCFNYRNNSIINEFIFEKETTLQLVSQINNEILEVKYKLIFINDDYNLRLLIKNQILNLDNTFNVSNIYGNVENIEIIPQEQYQIIYPLTITSHEYQNTHYQSSVCYNSQKKIIVNCFDDHHFMIEENTIENILYATYDKNKKIGRIIYLSKTEDINIMFINNTFNLLQINIQKVEIPYEQLSNHQANVIQQAQNLSIIQLQYDKKNYITLNTIYARELTETFNDLNLEVSYLFDSTYLFISVSLYQYINIQFIQITQVNEQQINYDITYQYKLQFNKILPETLESSTQHLDKRLKLFEIKIEKDLIHFEFSIFFQQYFALLISFQIDKKFQQIPKISNTAILRYQKEFQFNRLLFIDNNFTILLLHNETHKFVYVYDIRNRNFQYNIDSIQKLNNNYYTGIERFNQSHYVLQTQWNIKFITLDELRFSCETVCQPIQSILLGNDVSKISIEMSNFQYKQTQIVQVNIIIFTFIFILLKQRFSKKNTLKAKLKQSLQS